MATLNVTDPLHPGFDYMSGGGHVTYSTTCNCSATDTECVRLCHAAAQKVLDKSLEDFHEDP